MLCSNQLSYVATISNGTGCPEEARIFLNLLNQVKGLAWNLPILFRVSIFQIFPGGMNNRY